MSKQIILVGSGAMGTALAQGWGGTTDDEILIIDPCREGAYSSIDELLLKMNERDIKQSAEEKRESGKFLPDVIVFAVKPQIIKSILPLYKIFQNNQCLFISIAAGISIGTLKKYLGDEALCVRVMPNLGATVHCSVSGLYTSDNLSDVQREMVFQLFQRVGMALWVDSQEQIDAMTALSGSGPAYVFRFIESLVSSARKKGFDEVTANAMVLQTVSAAVELLKQGGTPSQWRQRVTSPGGTTAAAMAVFDHYGLDVTIEDAISAAYRRVKELSLSSGEN